MPALFLGTVLLSLGLYATAFDINYQGFDLDSELIDLKTKFQVWKRKFEKEFTSLEEEAKAMLTFAKNDLFIVSHNKEGHSYTVGHNEFSHLTSEEFVQQFTGYRNKDKYLRRTKFYNHNLKSSDPAPESVDWVARGAVTDPKKSRTVRFVLVLLYYRRCRRRLPNRIWGFNIFVRARPCRLQHKG